jgi:hypothetical protein
MMDAAIEEKAARARKFVDEIEGNSFKLQAEMYVQLVVLNAQIEALRGQNEVANMLGLGR